MRNEIKGFGTIVFEILSEICEDPIYASPTHARFTVSRTKHFGAFDFLEATSSMSYFRLSRRKCRCLFG